MSEDIDVLKDEEKEKLTLEASDFDLEKAERHGRVEKQRSNDHWVGGLILIGIGVVFLLANTTNIYINNWWALFILIPGVAKLAKSARHFRDDGRFSERARGSFTWGLILTLVAFTFIFNWSWGLIWPAFLIIFGLGALLSGVLD